MNCLKSLDCRGKKLKLLEKSQEDLRNRKYLLFGKESLEVLN